MSETGTTPPYSEKQPLYVGRSMLGVVSFLLVHKDKAPFAAAEIRAGTALPRGNVGSALERLIVASVVEVNESATRTYHAGNDTVKPLPLYGLAAQGEPIAVQIITGIHLPDRSRAPYIRYRI